MGLVRLRQQNMALDVFSPLYVMQAFCTSVSSQKAKLQGPPQFSVNDPSAMSEDCLTINIIRPGLQTLPENASLPVMTWIHGGGYILGASSLSLYDGSRLVAQSIAIVSSISTLFHFMC